MRKILTALLLALGLTAPAYPQSTTGPVNQILCNQIGQLAAGGTGLTQVVAAVTGKSIFLCGWHITNTGATGTFSFSYGTGSNCGTGTTTIIPAQSVTSTAPSADHTDYASSQTPASQAFCINPSVNTIAGIIYYFQF